VIHDSRNIACYLEERFPDRPSLFDGGGERAVARLVNHWVLEAIIILPSPMESTFLSVVLLKFGLCGYCESMM
jgi:glutathione S-transferase